MRQHQRRNTYDTERASRAATIKAQAQPSPNGGHAIPYEPETQAALELHTRLAMQAHAARAYPLPRRSDFAQRDANGVLKATEYARQLLAELVAQ